jgi:ribA/ribD-fused uncharacterized protein
MLATGLDGFALQDQWRSMQESCDVIGFYSHTRGNYTCFSNFHLGTFSFDLPPELVDAKRFPSPVICEFSEKAIMLCKAAVMDDSKSYRAIMDAKTPTKTKALGRKVSPWNEQRWREVVCGVAQEVVYQKFKKVPGLAAQLDATGSHMLAEATKNDRIWGIGLDVGQSDIYSVPARWKGSNILGWALMQVRSRLREEASSDMKSIQSSASNSGNSKASSSVAAPVKESGRKISFQNHSNQKRQRRAN